MSSEIFWAVFFGASLGTLLVHLVLSVIDEYRSRANHKRIHLLLDHLEDAEFEDWEDAD